MTDYYYVDCEEYREALSARLDDEEGPALTRQPTDDHLEHCAACARWYDNAALITRRTRTTAVVAWPDVADAVLTRVPVGAEVTAARLRTALGAVGVAQGAAALFALATGGGYQGAAWHLALAVALCSVAANRVLAAGLVPLLATFVAVRSAGFLAGDAGGGAAPALLTYALAVAGLVLVVLLTRLSPPGRTSPPPPGAAARLQEAENAHKWADRPMVPINRSRPTKAA